MNTETELTPVLPLRDIVVYPHMVIPLFVGREKSVAGLEVAMESNKEIILLTQKSPDIDEPLENEMYTVGTLGNILQLLKLPDGTLKVLVEGLHRVDVQQVNTEGDFYTTTFDTLSDISSSDNEAEVYSKTLYDVFKDFLALNKKVPEEVLSSLDGVKDPSQLADTVAANMPLSIEQKQAVLECLDLPERHEKLLAFIQSEIDLIKVEKRIRGRVKSQMEKSQREYYLNEQIKAIQQELGDINEGSDDLSELGQQIQNAGMSKDATEKAESEFKKLKMMSPMSAEASVVRTYIETLTGLPWKQHSRIKSGLSRAQKILDEQHYGLDKVKERILEYLAVQQRVKRATGPILCLVGPPGVGKTSLGRSIAEATGRKFTRMALGGVRDEAEIRGHRRTYIGAMPGKIIQNMSKVGTNNPMFLLDEIDKMGSDFRGDPSSALLEVLDPEQNKHFNDHYLEVDYDLSGVMFVATSNSMNIPPALLDRMEVIRIPGYTEDEKVNIALKYLLPKQIKNSGLNPKELSVEASALLSIVRYYTREAGVRNLEREISKICRKAVKSILLKETDGQIVVSDKNIEDYLGVKRYRYGEAEAESQIGQVTGLAWTEVGGELLSIESAVLKGKGKLSYTGQLGDVMQESIQAAMTVVRTHADAFGLEEDFYDKHDLHVHVPEGATPKDGPSAGIAMCTSLVSVLTETPVRSDVAMTGEITLRGEVLAIGGLKEKLLAAHRGGIKTVLIPEQNRKDLVDIPQDIRADLDIRPVRWIDEVLDVALTASPYTASEDKSDDKKQIPQEVEAKPKNRTKPIRHH